MNRFIPTINRIEDLQLYQLYIEQERLSANITRLTAAIQRIEIEQNNIENQRILNRMKSRRESAYILLRIVRRNIFLKREEIYY